MKTDCLVSVIVPVYNVEKYVGKCLNSLCKQTYENIEIIVVDDGSPDNSDKIINSYKMKDERIRFIKRKNGGLGAARNTGIRESKGEYICFVDSDDWVAPDYVECFLRAAFEDKSDVVISNISYVFEDGTRKPRTPEITEHEVVNNREALAREFIGEQYKFHAPNKCCKRDILINNEIWFPEDRLYEDVFTTYKILLASKTVSLIPDFTYYYLQSRTGSIMNTKIKRQRFTDMYDALDTIMDNSEICKLYLDDEKQKLYVGNVISLVNYIYPLVGVVSRDDVKKYRKLIKEDKNYALMSKGILQNRCIAGTMKLRAYMINYCFIGYCVLMKFIKRVLKGK